MRLWFKLSSNISNKTKYKKNVFFHNHEKSVQLLAYADGIGTIECIKRDVTAAFNVIDVTLEIKRRITLANRSYYGLNRQLSSKDPSRANFAA